ncbi:MAG: lysine--tRNA ligase, partial [Candidatus Methanomethylophilaceae archaeon]|nr:lysine--tRNA ligase [Candidatus Methanomethylophilaceae archaeon]
PDVPLDADQKAFLAGLADSLSAAEWNGDVIGQVISEAGKASPIGTKGAFKVLYQILINKERGPRLGNFLASMDRDFVIGRVTEASQ